MGLFAFILILTVIIFFHELGHLLTAKFFGFRVLAFSVGFGREVFGFNIGETRYKLCMIPLGGYVMFDPKDNPLTSNRSFLQKVIVAGAGPFMNMVLAFMLMFLVNLSGREHPSYLDSRPVVGYVEKDSLAHNVGIKQGDEIVSINGEDIKSWKDYEYQMKLSDKGAKKFVVSRSGLRKEFLVEMVAGKRVGLSPALKTIIGGVKSQSPAERVGLRSGDVVVEVNGQEIQSPVELFDLVDESGARAVLLKIYRYGAYLDVSVVPVYFSSDDSWRIGISSISFEMLEINFSASGAATSALKDVWFYIAAHGKLLKGLVTGESSTDSLSGPIGIYKYAGMAASQGWSTLLMLMAALSVSIGFINLLPIPVLDGGHIAIACIETLILRRKLTEKELSVVSTVGFVIIAALFIFTFAIDLF